MELTFVSLFLTVVYLSALSTATEARKLHPVILIPGDGGSQLEAKLNKPSTVAWYCWKKTDNWYNLWLSVRLLIPKVIYCLIDNMRLVYDAKTRTTSNSPGVDVRVPGFGETATVEWYDPFHNPLTIYFHTIVEGLVKMGYVRNKTVIGAPYDFRKAANEQGEYFKKFRQLIEDTYTLNGNTSVVLLGHSMGCTMSLYFLNHMTAAWKAKYIRSFISLAGPWGGAVKAIRLMISGDDLHIPIINPVNARTLQRTLQSTAWTMPSDEFWKPNETLVVSPAKNYTVKDIKSLFTDINYTTGYMMWEDTRKLVNPLKAPGVEIHCLYGVGVDTTNVLVYDKTTWHEGYPQSLKKDYGDGTVNLRSLLGCRKFKKQQKQLVREKTFLNVEHMKILQNEGVIGEIKRILSGMKY